MWGECVRVFADGGGDAAVGEACAEEVAGVDIGDGADEFAVGIGGDGVAACEDAGGSDDDEFAFERIERIALAGEAVSDGAAESCVERRDIERAEAVPGDAPDAFFEVVESRSACGVLCFGAESREAGLHALDADAFAGDAVGRRGACVAGGVVQGAGAVGDGAVECVGETGAEGGDLLDECRAIG